MTAGSIMLHLVSLNALRFGHSFGPPGNFNNNGSFKNTLLLSSFSSAAESAADGLRKQMLKVIVPFAAALPW